MSRSIHKFSWLIVLCGLPILLKAQQPAATETVPVADDTVRKMSAEERFGFTYVPEELRVGLDLSRIVSTMVNPDSRFLELNSDLRFGRYYLAADFGTGSQNRSTDSLQYNVNGSYFRIGPDVNFIPDNEDRNTLFIGLRYGRSWYKETLDAVYEEDHWAPLPVAVDRQSQGRWFEAVAGMRAMVWNNIYLGYTLRYKFGVKARDHNNFTSYEVPGFGRVGSGNAFSFNYHILYQIPFHR